MGKDRQESNYYYCVLKIVIEFARAQLQVCIACETQHLPIDLTHLSIKTSISKPQQEGTKDSDVYTVCVEGRDIYNPSPEMESISPVVTA
jgi:hypothetical protein